MVGRQPRSIRGHVMLDLPNVFGNPVDKTFPRLYASSAIPCEKNRSSFLIAWLSLIMRPIGYTLIVSLTMCLLKIPASQGRFSLSVTESSGKCVRAHFVNSFLAGLLIPEGYQRFGSANWFNSGCPTDSEIYCMSSLIHDCLSSNQVLEYD